MMSDTYEKIPKVVALCTNTTTNPTAVLNKKNNTLDLKCNVQHCDGSARLKNGIFECDTGRAKMQKTVTPSLTRSVDSETDRHGGMVTAALRCRDTVGVCTAVSARSKPCRHVNSLEISQPKSDDGTDEDVASATSTSTSTSMSAT